MKMIINRKKLAPYVRDTKGRWKAPINWHAVTLCVFFGIILGFYCLHSANASGNESKLGNVETIGETNPVDADGLSPLPDCYKVGEGDGVYFECTDPVILAKWKDYLESQIPKKKKATVTMYTSRAAETDSSPCIAANGKDICKLLKQGVQTCASNDYKLGTTLQIDGLGECIVMDRMNSRYTGTGRIDWYKGMDLKAARQHGVKQLSVAVIK